MIETTPETERAMRLLEDLGIQHGSGIHWPSPATKSRIYAFANLHGHSLNPSNSCPACDTEAVDAVRKVAGLPSMAKEARARVIMERKRACQGGDGKTAVLSDPCPAYHPSTDSCGTVVVDGLVRGANAVLQSVGLAGVNTEVEVGGRMIQPCGCRLFGVLGAARIETHKCPAGRWP